MKEVHSRNDVQQKYAVENKTNEIQKKYVVEDENKWRSQDVRNGNEKE